LAVFDLFLPTAFFLATFFNLAAFVRALRVVAFFFLAVFDVFLPAAFFLAPFFNLAAFALLLRAGFFLAGFDAFRFTTFFARFFTRFFAFLDAGICFRLLPGTAIEPRITYRRLAEAGLAPPYILPLLPGRDKTH
jgi:hypothetical protein